MAFKKILIVGFERRHLDEDYWKRLDSLASQVVILPNASPELKNNLADADCLLVSFSTAVGRGEIDSAPSLKYIGVLATAFGRIDVAYAKSKGIVVSNIPGYSTESVAEFVFAAILENCRNLAKARVQGAEGNYSDVGFSAFEIKGKAFGILGLGRIGHRVAELASAFGAKVVYWSKHPRADGEIQGITYLEPDELISKCDFISINLALNTETEKFFNANRIKSLKKGSVVVNFSPMDLVDVDALAARLENADVTFILDHADEMKTEEVAKIAKFNNCIIYPPIGFVSREARIAKEDIFLANVEGFLKGSPLNVVS